jgi:hypothetical protein
MQPLSRYLRSQASRHPSPLAFYAALGKDLKRHRKQVAHLLANLLVVLALVIAPFSDLKPSFTYGAQTVPASPTKLAQNERGEQEAQKGQGEQEDRKQAPDVPLGVWPSDNKEYRGGCNPIEYYKWVSSLPKVSEMWNLSKVAFSYAGSSATGSLGIWTGSSECLK